MRAVDRSESIFMLMCLRAGAHLRVSGSALGTIETDVRVCDRWNKLWHPLKSEGLVARLGGEVAERDDGQDGRASDGLGCATSRRGIRPEVNWRVVANVKVTVVSS